VAVGASGSDYDILATPVIPGNPGKNNDMGSILRNSVSVENYLHKVSSSNFGQNSTEKHQIKMHPNVMEVILDVKLI
jgi:hypothetical protein